MYYVIANTKDIESFYLDVRRLQSKGVPFTFDYIEEMKETGIPGGWGCARFDFPAPVTQIFYWPNTEYRYSEEQNTWLVDGQVAEYSGFVIDLHNYFVSLEGQPK
jgi:hypothetical protein